MIFNINPLKYCWLILMPFQVCAQTDSLGGSFISYKDKMSFELSLFESSNSFIFEENRQDIEHFIKITPNAANQIKVKGSYQIVSLLVGFTPDFLNLNNRMYNSRKTDVELRLDYKKWFQVFSTVHQRGFFFEQSLFPKIYNPNYSTLKIGGTTSLVLNDRFSYKQMFNRNQWQKKSAGSFIANFSFYYTSLNFDENVHNQGTNIFSFAFSPSYFYNFIIKKDFSVSMGIIAGSGVNIYHGDIQPIVESSARFRLGYNQPSFYFFVSSNATNFIQFDDDKRFNNSYINIQIGGGYRFTAPKRVEKFYQNAKKKVPFL